MYNRGDDALRRCSAEAQVVGRTDGDGEITDLEGIGVAKRRRREAGCFDIENSQIAGRVITEERSRVARAVVEHDHDIRHIGDNVVIGDDDAGGIQNDAGGKAGVIAVVDEDADHARLDALVDFRDREHTVALDGRCADDGGRIVDLDPGGGFRRCGIGRCRRAGKGIVGCHRARCPDGGHATGRNHHTADDHKTGNRDDQKQQSCHHAESDHAAVAPGRFDAHLDRRGGRFGTRSRRFGRKEIVIRFFGIGFARALIHRRLTSFPADCYTIIIAENSVAVVSGL